MYMHSPVRVRPSDLTALPNIAPSFCERPLEREVLSDTGIGHLLDNNHAQTITEGQVGIVR